MCQPLLRQRFQFVMLNLGIRRRALIVGQQIDQAASRIDVERRVQRSRVLIQCQDIGDFFRCFAGQMRNIGDGGLTALAIGNGIQRIFFDKTLRAQNLIQVA
jgi:hypothetical protein